jgi:hypothetical protein
MFYPYTRVPTLNADTRAQEQRNREIEPGNEKWRVGEGLIELEDLALLRLDNVSKGSWQIHLQMLRPLDDRPPRRTVPAPRSQVDLGGARLRNVLPPPCTLISPRSCYSDAAPAELEARCPAKRTRARCFVRKTRRRTLTNIPLLNDIPACTHMHPITNYQLRTSCPNFLHILLWNTTRRRLLPICTPVSYPRAVPTIHSVSSRTTRSPSFSRSVALWAC